MVISCGTVLAQYSKEFDSCIDKAQTQLAMHMCASDEAKRADTELNDVYRKLQSAASKQPNAVAKITAAERAWIAYRDAYIETMWPADDKQREYGSSFTTEANLLRAKLTRRQIEALKELLRQYSGSQR